MGGWWPDGSVTTASCGPRCVVVCHHPDGGDPTVLIRRRTADGTISQATATLPFAEEAAPPFRCLAAIEEPDGAVIVIGGTTVYSTIPIAILGYRVVGDVAEETTRLLTTDLEIDNQVNAMRLQRDDVGRLHAFGDETHDACYLHLVADGGRFHREAGLCVGTGDYLTRTSDAALRRDGAGIDLVMAAGWRPAFGDDGMFWMDGTAPVAAEAVRLPDGSLGQPLYPYVCVGPGGSVVASAVYVPPAPPFPETPGPADGTLRLWSLAPGGLVSSTADHPVPEGMVYEGRLDAMYRVLYCTSDEVVVDYRGMDGRWRIDVWAGGTVTERDLQTVASDSGEVRALMNFDTTPRDTWYQPCAGVRAIVPARNTTTVDHGAIYLEW
ncbi:MAG: hypothetical protein JXB32_17920 [Deltaproteobacteria bacterium]|nr:hypothetical protein [Deltaproteobacteria bacterium]